MRRGRSSRGRGGPSATSSYRCIPRAARESRGAADSSFAQDAARPPEHHGDEENERDDIAPLHREEEAAHGDELREDERGDEAANHVPQSAEHADQESNWAEGEPDRGMDVILQDEQARRE